MCGEGLSIYRDGEHTHEMPAATASRTLRLVQNGEHDHPVARGKCPAVAVVAAETRNGPLCSVCDEDGIRNSGMGVGGDALCAAVTTQRVNQQVTCVRRLLRRMLSVLRSAVPWTGRHSE